MSESKTPVSAAPFPYIGGKGRHADWIVSQFPEHKMYVELFGGAGAVLFTKPRSKVEVYNDLDGHIVHFFRVLREQPDELMDYLRCVPFAADEHAAFCRRLYGDEPLPDDDVQRAAEFFALRHMQFGAKYEGNSGFGRSRPDKDEATRYANARERLGWFADRLAGVTIDNLDYREMVEKYDTEDTLFYADPPYEGTEGRYLTSSGGFDHATFVDTLAAVEGDWVVSYADLPPPMAAHPLSDEWHVLEKDANHTIDGGGKQVTERLVCNFDPDDPSRSAATSCAQSALTQF